MSIFDSLNEIQQTAVRHNKGPLLILAGAGSGKTRVLTHRIAFLIDELDVNPYHILALTFTNKAASEMRERIDKLVGYGAENIWVSTFHSTCVRILRRYIESLGYDRSFTIYDTDDQKSLMKEVCKYLDIDTKNIKERTLMSVISSAKDELITPEEYEFSAAGDLNKLRYAQVYKEYQKRLKANNALDFDDLIFKTVELFQTNLTALTYYQNRFRYILVDEYQDTNTAQFRLISLMASSMNEFGEVEHNLCVVGDDDQSIYKFRGANIRNILDFEKEYTDTKVIKLEQNYRSSKNILDTANAVISNNLGRKDKSLWTQKEEGESVRYIQYETDYEEAAGIVADIAKTVSEQQANYKDFAILYRTNAQSRVFEEKLILKNIPYKIIGGINFYQRKEIKDLLAYLKTIENGMDGIAVKRIINIPKRGIGLTTIERLDDYALLNNTSFYDALRHAGSISGLERSQAKINSFVSLIEGLKSRLDQTDFSIKDLINEILEATGYIQSLEAQDEEEAQDRIGNINELINKAAAFEENSDEPPTLSNFLEEVALVADIDNLQASNETVVLMTLHSAKGLEFPYVYLCGMEDGIFPSYLSLNAENPTLEIEEERRLCYVGITRAQTRLSLSAARQRMMRGETQYNKPSQFILEIPRHLLSMGIGNTVPRNFLPPENYYSSSLKSQTANSSMRTFHGAADRPGAPRNPNPILDFEKSSSQKLNGISPTSPAYSPFSQIPVKQFDGAKLGELDFGIGDSVRHIKFGVGIVTAITKGGRDYEVTVDFPNLGVKKMLSSFAKLQKVEE